MTSTWYLDKVVLPGGTWFFGVPSNPNGLLTAPAGSLAQAADGTGPWKNTTGATVWQDLSAGGGGGSSPFVATNEFWIDETLADSPTFASLRMFSLIELALANINGGSLPAGLEFVLRAREEQDHAWDGTGWLDDRDGTIYAVGGVRIAAGLDVSAGITLPFVGGHTLTVKNMEINGAFTGGFSALGVNLNAHDCRIAALNSSYVQNVQVTGASVVEGCAWTVQTTWSMTNGEITDCSFDSDSGGSYTTTNVNHSGTTWSSALGPLNVVTMGGKIEKTLSDGDFVMGGAGPDNVAPLLTGTTIIVRLNDVTEDPSYIFQGVDAILTNVSIRADLNDADADLFLFRDPGTGTTAELNDVRLSYNGPGSISYESGGVVTTNNGFVVLGANIGAPSGTFYNDGLGFVAVVP